MRERLIATALAWSSLAPAFAAEPDVRLFNPSGLWQPSTFSQIATVRGGTTVYISGQTARDAKGAVVGQGNLDTQTRQVFENLKTALAAVGAEFQHVVKINTYVKNLQPNDRVMIADFIARYFPQGRRPAHTLVGVPALAVDELLIEIEAVAALP